MQTRELWVFIVASLCICGSPGPNMLFMMMSSARYGLKVTFFAMAGCFLAVFTMISASVAGVGAILAGQVAGDSAPV